MNDQTTHNPLEKLDQLLSQHAEVLRERSLVPERLAGAFDIALQGVGVQIESVLEDASLLELKTRLIEQREADAEMINGLFSRGLLDETQRDEQLDQIFRHPDYTPLRMIAVAERALVGAVGTSLKASVDVSEVDTATETIPAEDPTVSVSQEEKIEPETPNAEKEVERVPAELTIIELPDRTELKVGRSRGKRYKLSETRYHSQKNYTEERKLIVELLARANGQDVKIQEIQQTLEDRGLIVDKHTTGQIRFWLEKIEFYGEKLFIHNGKRGPASSYHTNPRFDVSLQHKKIESRERVTTTEEKTAKPAPAKATVAPLPEPETIALAVEKGAIPLRESAVLMTFLNTNEDLLGALGLPVPEKTMVEAIESASYEEDAKNKVIRSGIDAATLERERISVGLQFKAVFSDEKLFDEFVDNISEDDVLYPMVEYLTNYDDDQWDVLLNQVLRATTSTVFRESSQGHNGSNPNDMITVIKLPNGKTYRRVVNFETHQHIFETNEFRPREIEIPEDEEVSTQPIKLPLETISTSVDAPKSIPDEGVQIRVASAVEPAAKEKPTVKESQKTWEINLKKVVGETLSRLEEDGAIFEGTIPMNRVRMIATTSIKIGTRQSVEDLVQAGLLADVATNQQQYQEISLREVILMMIFNSNRNIFDSRARRREALAIVDSSIERFLENWRKRQAS